MSHGPAQGSTYACIGYTLKGVVELTPIFQPSLVSMKSHQNPKAERKQHNRHQHKEIIGRLNTEKENSHEHSHWNNWSNPGKASGTEGLAVQQRQAQQHLSLSPWDQWWQQSHIMLIQSCSWLHRGGSHCNSHSCHHLTGPYNHQRWSSGIHSTLRHIEKLTTKKNSHYIEMCMWVK